MIIYSVFPEVNLEEQLQGEISILTYNVAGLPQRISSAKTHRRTSMLSIGEKLNDFDIVNLQEDFNFNPYLYRTSNHSYRSNHRGRIPFGDGLSTLSRYPIIDFKRIPWHKCNGTDCLTTKGFSVAKILLAQGVTIDVYNVHATSGMSQAASKTRNHNLIQLAQYIQDHSKDRPLLVLGDFNAYYTFQWDNMNTFLSQTKLSDAWLVQYKENKIPLIDDLFKVFPILDLKNEEESIDKILFRNSDSLTFKVNDYNIEKDIFINSDKKHLSDHLAVSANLSWEFKSTI